MVDLLNHSIVAIAELIRRREISSLEVTTELLARIERVDPVINAFIAVDAEHAIDRAKAADESLARDGVKGPLHGVPLAHKDLFYRAGEPASGGSSLRKDWRASYDATVLRRLDGAGAIAVGRLNMAEFAYDPTGDNRLIGLARNPWNVEYICGGSSSGSGAAVAACLCFGSLGSDTGGSIRLPASICGVVGIKPTHGRVSSHGCMPLSFSLDCIGPLARNVRDAARLLSVIAGPDPQDPTTLDRAVENYEAACEVDPRGVRIGIPENYFWHHVSDVHASALHAAIERLFHLGCLTKPIKLPGLGAAVAAANIVLGAESAALHKPLFARHADEYNLPVRTRLENGLGYSAIEYIDALRYRGPALSQFLDAVSDVDLIVAPTLGVRPPTVIETQTKAAGDVSQVAALLTYWTRPVNFLGVPAISVPVGLDEAGIPIGIQLIGKPFGEAILIRAAAAIEASSDMVRRSPNDLATQT